MFQQSQADKQTRLVRLRLLATSDVHASLLDYDYTKDRETKSGSLARAASKIDELRDGSCAALLLDNGDFLQGAAIADTDDNAAFGSIQNPVIEAMNHLSYDAVGLGNHEFNLTAEELQHALNQARFPVLCANLQSHPNLEADAYKGLWQPHQLLRVKTTDQFGAEHDLRVGVFAVLPPQVLCWDKIRIQDRLVAKDIVSASQEQIACLKALNADVVVGLIHSGISVASNENGQSDAENVAQLVAGLDGIDAIFCGHVHRVFPGHHYQNADGVDPQSGSLFGTPAVMPGAHGSHLGQIDLVLGLEGGAWSVVESSSKAHALVTSEGEVAENSALRDVVDSAHLGTLRRLRKTIGQLVGPVTSYFSMVREDCASRLVAEAKLAYIKDIVEGTEYADVPVLASVAPLKCGGRGGPLNYIDVAKGDVSARAIADIQPYSNHISVWEMAGQDVAEWLEMGFSVYNQVTKGACDQTLFERDAATYNREAVFGLSYGVDLSQPARYRSDGRLIAPRSRRVTDIKWRGALIEPDQRFLFVTNDYRGGGGGNFPGLCTSRELPIRPAKVRQVLERHIAKTSGRRMPGLETWRLVGLANTSACFDTGPGAAAYVGFTGMPLERVGEASDGFVRYRLGLDQIQ